MQDRYFVWESKDGQYAVGIVADGSTLYSFETEKGAELLAHWMGTYLASSIEPGYDPDGNILEPGMDPTDPELWKALEIEIAKKIQQAIKAGTHPFCFFSTIVGFVRTPTTTLFFALGDGFIFVNGTILRPPPCKFLWGIRIYRPYLAAIYFHWLLRHLFQGGMEKWPYPSDEVNHLFLGTDGVEGLLEDVNKLQQFLSHSSKNGFASFSDCEITKNAYRPGDFRCLKR